MGVTALNDVWALPDADFGDPSHVNAKGREIVTGDFIARVSGRRIAGGAGLRGRRELRTTLSSRRRQLEQAGQ